MKITLPVGYSAKICRQNARNVVPRPFNGCHLVDVDIAECSSQDVHLVAEWHQNWCSANAPVVVTPYRASPTWLEDFRQSPSLARLIVVDGKFYSPMRQKEGRLSKSFVHPITVEDLYRQMLGPGSRQTILGDNLESMFVDYERSVRAAKGWDGYRAQAVLPPDGFELQNCDFDMNVRRLRQMVAPFLLVDGMIWTEISEPCLVVRNESGGSRLCLGRKNQYRLADWEMIFSFCEYDSALAFMSSNWKPKAITLTLTNLNVFKPEALTASTDLEEVKRGVEQFIVDAGKLLPIVSRRTGDAWYDLRDALKSSRGKTSTNVATSMCAYVQGFLDSVSADGVKLDGPASRTVELGKRIIDRWEMRPVQPSRSPLRR